MQWPLPWLEALGLLAVVFAAGNGIGFGLSRLSGPSRRRKAPRPQRRVATLPAAEPIALVEATQTKAPATPQVPVTAPVADPPKPDSVVSALVPPLPQVTFSMKVRYPINPFGELSVTRPNADQPSN